MMRLRLPIEVESVAAVVEHGVVGQAAEPQNRDIMPLSGSFGISCYIITFTLVEVLGDIIGFYLYIHYYFPLIQLFPGDLPDASLLSKCSRGHRKFEQTSFTRCEALLIFLTCQALGQKL